MAIPVFANNKWTLEVDPDDEVFYVADVGNWLTDNSTTTTSFLLVPTGVTVIEQGLPQGDRGALLPAKLRFTDATGTTERSCTWRVTTADGQRFDKTMYFKPVQN